MHFFFFRVIWKFKASIFQNEIRAGLRQLLNQALICSHWSHVCFVACCLDIVILLQSLQLSEAEIEKKQMERHKSEALWCESTVKKQKANVDTSATPKSVCQGTKCHELLFFLKWNLSMTRNTRKNPLWSQNRHWVEPLTRRIQAICGCRQLQWTSCFFTVTPVLHLSHW